ncbi:cache domain-containing protein [Chryseolinea sp. T2]|uniref:cache domain-containing protein n=1 Tax=Chryseolinea sp. T2 TaxID=3129255 RepID=UPI003076BA41
MKKKLNLNLKQQITLMITLALIVPPALVGFVSIYRIQTKARADIEQFRTDELNKLKLYLKHITDIAYGIVEVSHQTVRDSASLTTDAMKVTLDELSRVRFDKGEGYFWVTDNKLPYPTMLMHAEKPELNGSVLDDAKYNVERHNSRNIYQVRVELANANGEAYVEYVMRKPGTQEVFNKISYSRLYKPLGWVISTGFYTDQIEAAILAKEDALKAHVTSIIIFFITLALLVLTAGLIAAFYFSKQLSDALVNIKDKLKQLALGQQVEQMQTKRTDEVGDMATSLNQLVDGLKTYTSFAREIGKGDLDQKFEPLSKDDVLGTELIVMRDSLRKAEREKSLRDWANEGLAKMGDVLRRNNNDTKVLTDEVLKELVKYLKVNQGALFIVSDGNAQELELFAAYAYNKRKYIKRKISFGEGLAGQCVMERQTIHLREVPEDYVQITSGLGHSLPRTIILVPLLTDQAVFGVLELASFKTFDTHEIAFIEKVAESIASTIATVQTNEHTKTLLQQSQQMQEEMKSQEEEMRQNMEELSATQEQMARQMTESRELHEEISVRERVFGLTTILSEADPFGTIKLVNDKLCEVSKYSREELLGKPHSIFRHPDMPKELFKFFWDTIKAGRVFKGIIKNRAKDGTHYWVDATIMPVQDANGNITKYIGARYHITNEGMAIDLYNRQAAKMNWPLLNSRDVPSGHMNGHKVNINGHEPQTA